MQADAFNGYDGIYLESQGRIIEVACWTHARRKFHESRRLDGLRMETAYYRDVLTRLPAMLPGASEEELLPLLPHRWHPA